jgi:hypothetical protein
MLTPDGWQQVAEWLAGRIQEGAWVVVADSQGQSAVATVSKVETKPIEGGGTRLTCSAAFPAADANFEWTKRSIKLADNTVIDREVEDLGRKVEGSEWEIEVGIDFGVPAP